MGYTRLAIKSLSWVTAFRLFYRLLAFGRTIILARLLTPQQFGEFGIAALVLALVELLTETGINVFIVQLDDDEAVKSHVNTAWVVSILRGLIISIVIVLSSWFVADFFKAPNAHYLLVWMALVPLIRGFINPAEAKFQRHLQFDKEFLIRSSYTIMDAVITLLFAFSLRSPISLVYGLMASALTEVLISIYFVKPRPYFNFHPEQFRRIIHSGKWVTSAGVLSYFANDSIDASIGKLLTTQALGYYQMAYKVSVLLIDELTELVNRVAFPLYAKMASDTKQLKKAFLKSTGMYVAVGLLSMAGVYWVAPYVIPIMLGTQWIQVIPTVQLLTLMGAAIVVTTPTNPLFLAVKHQDYLTAAVLNQLLVIIGGIAVVIAHPRLESIIWVSIISMMATIPLRLFFTYRILSKPTH